MDVPLEREKGQRTLFDCRKVVKLDASAVCFNVQDIEALKPGLSDPSTSKHQLLNSLRKLDCYKLQLGDLTSTQIGGVVSALTLHPRLEVARLASAVVAKWREQFEQAEDSLFAAVPYDVEAAAAAPEGAPEDFFLKAPVDKAALARAEAEAAAAAAAAEEEAAAAAAAAARKASLRQRLRREEQLFDSDSEEDGGEGGEGRQGRPPGKENGTANDGEEDGEEDLIEESSSEGEASDDEWRPSGTRKSRGKRKTPACGGGGSAKRQAGKAGGSGAKARHRMSAEQS